MPKPTPEPKPEPKPEPELKPEPKPEPEQESVKGQWEALEEMQAQKLTKSICVSNFNPKQLDAVISMGGTVRVASRCSK